MKNGEHPGQPPKSRGADWQEWYQRYLRSWAWEEKRQQVFERADHRCEGCGENRATEVHHSSYKNVGYEFLFELIAICSECHARYHGRASRRPVEPAPVRSGIAESGWQDETFAGSPGGIPEWLLDALPSSGSQVMVAAPARKRTNEHRWYGPVGMKVCDALEASPAASVPALVRATGLTPGLVITALKYLKDHGTVQRSLTPGGSEIWSLT